jgi:hypothetical protein
LEHPTYFALKPVGSLKGRIVFQFYNESGKPIKTNIVDFTVSQRTGGRWKPVWSLVGQTHLKEISMAPAARALRKQSQQIGLPPAKYMGHLLGTVLAGRLGDISVSKTTEQSRFPILRISRGSFPDSPGSVCS